MSVPASLEIAVLDDDDALRDQVLVPGLSRFGFNALGLATPTDLYRTLLSRRFQMVILDLDLPGEDGITVAYHLRRLYPTLGIVMLSGHGEEAERIASLDCGADAYLVKPVGIELLAAQLHSLWRRVGPRQQAEQDALQDKKASAGSGESGWFLPGQDGAVIPLARVERALYDALTSAGGQPCRRDDLVASITRVSPEFDPARLDVLVHRLRRKISESARTDLSLVTIRGVGYGLVSSSDADQI